MGDYGVAKIRKHFVFSKFVFLFLIALTEVNKNERASPTMDETRFVNCPIYSDSSFP